MVSSIYNFNAKVWLAVEESLTPLSENSNQYKIVHILPCAFLLPLGLMTEACVCAFQVSSYIKGFFSQTVINPREDFLTVCQDSRKWEEIGAFTDQISLGLDDENFSFGVATCTYQDSGSFHCPNAQWVKREEECLPLQNRSGRSANLFELYKTDVGRKEITRRLHKLGVKTYRFSIDWSQIEPSQGKYDLEKTQFYLAFCRHLREEGFTIDLTMHHFAEPMWFHEKGSFEKEENIADFLRFSKYVYSWFTEDFKGTPLVNRFYTINEPAIEMFSRYIRGAYSPAKFFQFTRGGNFLKGALKAHKIVYETLKKMPRSSEVKISMTHQRLSFETKNPLLYPIARYLTRLTNDTLLNYFRTGDFEFKIPFFCNMFERGTGDKPTVDDIGLQYYTRVNLDEAVMPFLFSKPKTQMPFTEDPEGIYEAIIEVHNAFKKPVIISESGISTHNEKQRARYLERLLYAIQKGREKIGKNNLIGHYLWSFCDNLEWEMGLDPQRFGAYGLVATEILGEIQKTLADEPKEGVAPFIKVAQAWKTAQETKQSSAVA